MSIAAPKVERLIGLDLRVPGNDLIAPVWIVDEQIGRGDDEPVYGVPKRAAA
jgi:hypothetical protein